MTTWRDGETVTLNLHGTVMLTGTVTRRPTKYKDLDGVRIAWDDQSLSVFVVHRDDVPCTFDPRKHRCHCGRLDIVMVSEPDSDVSG
jgi:hypothetical protein